MQISNMYTIDRKGSTIESLKESIKNEFDSDSDESQELKVVVVGDATVGKTSLLVTFTSNSFPINHEPTVFDNYIANIKQSNSPYQVCQIHLFDTAGQKEEFRDVRPLSYTHTDIFLVCFSLVDVTSFENIKKFWIPEIKNTDKNAKIILVGTKSDLGEDEESLESRKKNNDIERLISEENIQYYYKTSSKQYQGLNELFQGIVDYYLSKPEQKINPAKKQSCCKCVIL